MIYARALFKPRIPETKTLAQLIADDRARFERDVPGITIKPSMPIVDGDGKSLKAYLFTPPTKGSWELAAYSEEGEFYLIFIVSAQSQEALDRATADFKKIVGGYRERP